MTWLEEYAEKILSGEIVSCEKIKQIYKRLLNELREPQRIELRDSEGNSLGWKTYRFDESKANRPIKFIESFCKQSQGKFGEPIVLDLFQKAMLQAIFGIVDEDGIRRYNEVLLIVARKNGKTTLLAAIELYLLLGDNEGAPEIYNIATKLDQAKKGYDEARRMIQHSPLLAKRIRKRQSDLYCSYNFGTIKALASNTRSLDGLNAHGVVIDELSAILNRDTYDLMKQSQSARKQPLLICISTNGFIRDCIFDDQYKYAVKVLDGTVYNPRFLPIIYELDDVSEWTDENAWVKANPGLGTIKRITFLREMVQKAKDDLSSRPSVLCKDFNLKQNANTAWLKWDWIEQCKGEIPRNIDYCIGGFDAADSVDLAAAVAIMKKPDDPKLYVRSMFWIPESVIEEQVKSGSRQERDNVPYMQWVAEGWMRTVPGCKVDKRVFLDWFVDLREEEGLYSLFIGYDPWHIDDSLLRDFSGNFGERAMNVVRQGVKTLSEPMKSLEVDFKAGNVVFDNPVMQMCLANTEIRADINGNIQPVKGLDARKRIDGTAALLCAYRQLIDHHDEYTAMNA